MKIIDFKKTYNTHQVSVKNIVSEKRIILLKGKNGTGKSTLLKAMNGLISFQGSIHITESISYMNEQIKLPKDFLVCELIESLNMIDKNPSDDIVRLIDRFELHSKMNEPISSLSKGMKMKLQLLCTFMDNKDLYLLDEPFSGLDDHSVESLIKYIPQSNKKYFITTHIDVSFPCDCEVIQL